MLGLKQDMSKFSFGVTSAIVTSLALMLGLDQTASPRSSIIGALLIIAVADNIADSLGIHVYRESVPGAGTNPRVNTISNFLARIGVMALFIGLVAVLPLEYAIILSIAVGLGLLVVLSYYIALEQKEKISVSIAHHLGITIAVIVLSHFLGQWIGMTFSV
jgi:VIT1/CCC1 family predicted Fe2+/Mn2+ transporter